MTYQRIFNEYTKCLNQYNQLKELKSNQRGGADAKSISTNDLELKLAKEYARYKVVQKMFRLERSPKYVNALELVLLSMANDQTRGNDEVFLDIPNNHSYYAPMFGLVKYNLLSYNEITGLVNQLNLLVKKFMEKKEYKKPKKFGNNQYVYFCDKYTKACPPNRIDVLRGLVPSTLSSHADLLILIMLLRYECIGSKFQQWNLPFKFYQYLYTHENVRIEGFSSPLNCQLMMLGNDIRYCSLFYDTDGYFGSSGNIARIDFVKLSQKYSDKKVGILLIPPHSPYLISMAMKLVLKWSQLTSNFVYYMISWNKTEIYEFARYYRELLLSDKLLYRKRLNNYQWYFENTTQTPQTVGFKWGEEMHIHVIGPNQAKSDYNQMLKFLADQNEVTQDQTQLEKKLSREYARFQSIKQILALGHGYEWRNIVERFLNSMANVERKNKEDEQDQVFVGVPITDFVYKKMGEEILEKKMSGHQKIVEKTWSIVQAFLKNKSDITLVKRYGKNGDTFFCEDLVFQMDPTRIIQMISRAVQNHQGAYYILHILIVLVRYECIQAGGQNWNIPFKWYEYVYRKYGVTLECFGSPLNSQLLLLGPNTNFCSLFKDTDSVFGSMGNLFKFDVKPYSDKQKGHISLTLNPPAIEFLMSKMVALMNEWFKIVPRLRIFSVLPYWPDNEAIRDLENHQYLKHKAVLKSGEFYYENSMSPMVPKIYHTGSCEVFVLANFNRGPKEPEYSESDKMLHPPY